MIYWKYHNTLITLIYGTILYIEIGMSKKAPSDNVIIPTHEGYNLPLQFLLGLTYMPMRTYPTEECKILSFVVLTPNMDSDTSLINLLMLNMMNMINDLNNLVSGMVLQNILYTLWPLRSFSMPLWISSSVLPFIILSNQWHPIFTLNLFVGRCTPSSNHYYSGIKKVSHF